MLHLPRPPQHPALADCDVWQLVISVRLLRSALEYEIELETKFIRRFAKISIKEKASTTTRYCVLNVRALSGTFNQEKALVIVNETFVSSSSTRTKVIGFVPLRHNRQHSVSGAVSCVLFGPAAAQLGN